MPDIFDGLYVLSFDGTLPVELSSFTLSASEGAVALNWTTATETNNFGFEIQRKSEGDFSTIGFVEGHGNSNSKKIYSFIDSELNLAGNYYYRLKQIDNDGTFQYSDVLEIEVVLTEFKLKQNYPNPFNPVTTIEYHLPVDSKITLKIYDVLGHEIVILLDEEKKAGSYKVVFDSKDISSGTYFYKLQADKYIDVKKMIVIK